MTLGSKLVVATVAVACHRSPKVPPLVTARPDRSLACLISSTPPKAKPLPPERGGYRILAPDARAALRTAIDRESRVGDVGFTGAYMVDALGRAIRDLTPDLRRCMSDPPVPGLQYAVTLDVIGARTVGALVDRVAVRRIERVGDDGAIVQVATAAEPCFAQILTAIELPPGGGPASVETVINYEDCRPR